MSKWVAIFRLSSEVKPGLSVSQRDMTSYAVERPISVTSVTFLSLTESWNIQAL